MTISPGGSQLQTPLPHALCLDLLGVYVYRLLMGCVHSDDMPDSRRQGTARWPRAPRSRFGWRRINGSASLETAMATRSRSRPARATVIPASCSASTRRCGGRSHRRQVVVAVSGSEVLVGDRVGLDRCRRRCRSCPHGLAMTLAVGVFLCFF